MDVTLDLSRLPEQVYEMIKRVIGEIKQDILLLDD